MAPRKRRSDDGEKPAVAKPESSRETRSSTRLKANGSAPSVAPSELPAAKKAKTNSKIPKEGKASKGRKTVASAADSAAPAKAVDGSETKTIVIEHCKQCTSFKTRAIQVKDALEKGLSEISVLVNPEKPRMGCFEIREEGGETFISLLDMKRPFKPMKALDMDKVISDIIDKIIK